MAELIEEVDGSRGMSSTEHALRSVLNGDIESVRQSLTQALDSMGYNVISEEPLYARRMARGWAVYYSSANILEYPIKLTIGLKQLSPNVTLATFDYTVKHSGGVSFKGDQQTLKREAEAIIALATSSPTATVCIACETKQIDDARFCRICGAPNAGVAPAELEVLRLTAGTRAGQHLITTGAILAAVSFLIALPFILFGDVKVGGLVAVLLLPLIIAGLIILVWGMHQLHRTLNPDLSPQQKLPISVRQVDSTKGSVALPSTPDQTFITEGTTGLLTPKLQEREKEPVYSKGRDTSPTD
jgi:hypothetical protein